MSDGRRAISLIICTRNRAPFLGKCLESVRSEEIREADGELIVVNNGSTDETETIIREYQQRAGFPVIYVYEAKVGLSRARNAGILASSGEIVAFTDDDCYLKPGYFRAVSNAFRDSEISYCGGRILLFDPSDANYGCISKEKRFSIPPFSFLKAGAIQGANMIVRSKVFRKIGLFDPRLGAGTKFRCEDIDFCAQASLAGLHGAFIPEIVVLHHHRRKPGADIESLKRQNDYARGAYYAKYILRGNLNYLRGWIRTTRENNRNHDYRTELYGAVHFTFEILRTAFRPDRDS